MPFRFRKKLRLGPIELNFTQAGYQSLTLRLGPWSWNSRSRQHRVNTPGPGGWVSRRKNRRRQPR